MAIHGEDAEKKVRSIGVWSSGEWCRAEDIDDNVREDWGDEYDLINVTMEMYVGLRMETLVSKYISAYM